MNIEISRKQIGWETTEKAIYALSLLWCALPAVIILYCIIRGLTGDYSLDKIEELTAASCYYSMITTYKLVVRIVGSITLLAGLALVIKNHGEWLSIDSVKKKPWFVLLFALLMWSALSMVMSYSPLDEFFGTELICDGFSTYLVYCGVFICGSVLQKEKFRIAVLRTFCAVISICAIIMLLQETGNPTVIGVFPTVKSVVFQNSNYFAYVLCMSITVLAGLLIYDDNYSKTDDKRTISFWKLAYVIQYIVQIIALLFNNTFGSYLAVVVAIPFLILFTAKNGRLSKMGRAKSAKLLAIIIFVILILSLANYVGWFGTDANLMSNFDILGEDVTTIVSNSETVGAVGSGRGELWIQAFEKFKAHPILGGGPDYCLPSKEFPIEGPPHNDPLQLLSYLGLPGFLLYYGAMFSLAIYLWKRLEELSPSTVICSATVICYMASAFFGHPMYNTTPYFWMILGMITLKNEQDVPLFSFGLPEEKEPAYNEDELDQPEQQHRVARKLKPIELAIILYLIAILAIGWLRTIEINECNREKADLQAMRVAEAMAAIELEKGDVKDQTEYVFDANSYTLFPYSEENIAIVGPYGLGRNRESGGFEAFLLEVEDQEKDAVNEEIKDSNQEEKREYEMSDPTHYDYDEAIDYTDKLIKVTVNPQAFSIYLEWIDA